MQRFFSPFPDGRLGAGLLLLRAVASLMGSSLVVARLTGPSTAVELVSGAVSILSGMAVLIGLFTPGSAMVLGATVAWFWFPIHADLLRLGVPAALMTIGVAVAIALLGPGAFSIDARLFGPREIVAFREGRGPRTSD